MHDLWDLKLQTCSYAYSKCFPSIYCITSYTYTISWASGQLGFICVHHDLSHHTLKINEIKDHGCVRELKSSKFDVYFIQFHCLIYEISLLLQIWGEQGWREQEHVSLAPFSNFQIFEFVIFLNWFQKLITLSFLTISDWFFFQNL